MTLSNNHSWIGQSTAGARVLAYFCEDDKDELHRRQIDINNMLGIRDPQNALRHFHMQSRAGKENLLMTFDKGVGKPTAFYSHIIADIVETKAQVVILDNAAQLYGGDENDRAQVTQCGNLLQRLADATGTTIIFLGHPAKADASEYSGSTAWDACVRSRLYFGRPKPEPGDKKNPNIADTRFLRRSKSNYSRIGDEVQVRWREGAFEPVGGDFSNIDVQTAMRNVEKQAMEKFLELLDKLTAQGRNVSHALKATNYAPKIMASMAGCNFTQKQLAEAMDSLFNASTLVANAEVGRRTNRGKIYGIARAKISNDNDCTEVHDGFV